MQDWTSNAVMVTGPPQSGTTLLLNLLDGGQQMLVYPDEPSFPVMLKQRSGYRDIRHVGRDWLLGTPNPLHFASVLEETPGYPSGFRQGKASPIPADYVPAVSDLKAMASKVKLRAAQDLPPEQIDLAGYLSELVDFVYSDAYGTEQEVIEFAMDALRRHSCYRDRPVKRWAFKNPTLVPYSLQPFINFQNQYPRGKTILIWRDPHGFYNSHKSLWKKKLGRRSFGLRDTLRFAGRTAPKMEECYWAIQRELPEVLGDNLLLVQYENLVSDPEAEMRGICDFLGIQFEEILTRPTTLGASASVVTSRTGDSPNVVSSTSADKWKRELSGWEIALVDALTRRYLPGGRDKRGDGAFRALLYFTWSIGFQRASQRDGTPFCRGMFGRSRHYYSKTLA